MACEPRAVPLEPKLSHSVLRFLWLPGLLPPPCNAECAADGLSGTGSCLLLLSQMRGMTHVTLSIEMVLCVLPGPSGTLLLSPTYLTSLPCPPHNISFNYSQVGKKILSAMSSLLFFPLSRHKGAPRMQPGPGRCT